MRQIQLLTGLLYSVRPTVITTTIYLGGSILDLLCEIILIQHAGLERQEDRHSVFIYKFRGDYTRSWDSLRCSCFIVLSSLSVSSLSLKSIFSFMITCWDYKIVVCNCCELFICRSLIGPVI